MFTGLIEEIGIIKQASPSHLIIRAKKVLEDTKPGDSVDVNGACLTVTSVGNDSFSVDVMTETSRRTNLGKLRYGDVVNLERAMLASGRFGGHFVQGHVDDIGRVIALTPEEEAVIARISAPAELMPYMVNKGFIAVDGVSLTIIDCRDLSFSVSLVTYTCQHTTLGSKKVGDIVDLEADIIAKYIEQFTRRRDSQGVTPDFLEKHGFLKVR